MITGKLVIRKKVDGRHNNAAVSWVIILIVSGCMDHRIVSHDQSCITGLQYLSFYSFKPKMIKSINPNFYLISESLVYGDL